MAIKKFFTKEVKIALAFIAALAILVYGINFLKGIDILTPSNHYFLQYKSADGLVVSNGVFVKGYKVGQVKNIKYDFSKEIPFVVEIIINEDVRLPEKTIAYLFDESIMGGKGINLIFSEATDIHESGDTLTTDVQPGLLASVGEIVPQLKQTIENLNSLVSEVNELAKSQELSNSLKNIEGITSELNKSSKNLNIMMNTSIPDIINNVNQVTGDLKITTGELKKIQFEDIAQSLDSTLNNIQILTERLNSEDSSLGLLLNDKALYNNLNSTVNSANSLLIDLKDNPKRYVHFSLWGSKEKKEKSKK